MDRFECGTEAATPMSGSLELCVDSDWAQMGRVNEDIYRFLVSCKLSEELAARYTMVACELTENGIKYGNPDKSPGGVHVRIRLEGGEIYLEVSSAVGDESKPFLVELDRTIQWARGFQDPFEAYIARLRAISHEPLDIDRSGLGLVRITYEGRAALDFYLEEDRTLSVSAVSQLNN